MGLLGLIFTKVGFYFCFLFQNLSATLLLMSMNVDLLVISAHPDDAEISAGGTILKMVKDGRSVAVVDMTQGEMGSRGSGPLRLVEAEEAAKQMGVVARENMGLADVFFTHSPDNIRQLIEIIRKYRPKIVFTNSLYDRHPDHAKAAKMVADACFYSGLRKIETTHPAWRPQAIYHFNQDYMNKPDFVVDITGYLDQKIEVLKCFGSQFYDPNSKEPETPISGKEFFDFIRARAIEFGRPSGFLHGEGFVASRTIGVRDVFDLV